MNNDFDISVAPMMDWTDRHCRYFHRLIAPNIRLYTEMVTTGALIHGDADRHLRFSSDEHPIALQLGGSDPDALAIAAKMGADYGYDEINLNCGCPSDRVQKGKFGACLMAEPDLVAKTIESMKSAVDIPVTIKCRIGIDDVDDEPFLRAFLSAIQNAGCETVILHARKAILAGLSPKQNREIPPLRYDLAAQMHAEFPTMTMIVNGGIDSLDIIKDKQKTYDGVMIGRKAYQTPYFLSEIESALRGTQNLKSREDVVNAMIPYIEQQQKDHGTPPKTITRHMMGLFAGRKGAKAWKRYLSENAFKSENANELLNSALNKAFEASQNTENA